MNSDMLSLPHTHANMAGPVGTDELVNGSNCATAGDFICDTPADPILSAVPGRVDSLCNYTDTVYTDANGDLFQPDTRNIMSYAPYSCYNQFSPQQLDQVRFCLDNIRFYLRSEAPNMVVDNTERRFCFYDADITLSATPAGGTFSGPGVSGNTFSPSQADVGNHLITYSLPGISILVSSTDQYATYPDTSLLLSTCAQSFTAGITADLSGISVYLDNPTQQDVTPEYISDLLAEHFWRKTRLISLQMLLRNGMTSISIQCFRLLTVTPIRMRLCSAHQQLFTDPSLRPVWISDKVIR